MKIKEGFILHKIADSYHVIAVGKAVKNFNGIINLNQTGAFLWEKLSIGATEEELVKFLISEYGIDLETATSDVSKFTKGLKEAGLAE